MPRPRAACRPWLTIAANHEHTIERDVRTRLDGELLDRERVTDPTRYCLPPVSMMAYADLAEAESERAAGRLLRLGA